MEYLREAIKELQNLKILETKMNNISDTIEYDGIKRRSI